MVRRARLTYELAQGVASGPKAAQSAKRSLLTRRSTGSVSSAAQNLNSVARTVCESIRSSQPIGANPSQQSRAGRRSQAALRRPLAELSAQNVPGRHSSASDVAGGPQRIKRRRTGDENLPPVRLAYMTCTTAVPLNRRAVFNRALKEHVLDSKTVSAGLRSTSDVGLCAANLLSGDDFVMDSYSYVQPRSCANMQMAARCWERPPWSGSSMRTGVSRTSCRRAPHSCCRRCRSRMCSCGQPVYYSRSSRSSSLSSQRMR